MLLQGGGCIVFLTVCFLCYKRITSGFVVGIKYNCLSLRVAETESYVSI